MVGLSEEIGKITNLLEDAIEEKDWSSVQKCFDELEDGNGGCLCEQINTDDDDFNNLIMETE